MHKISKTGPEYADHRLDQEGAGFLLPQGRLLWVVSGPSPSYQLKGRYWTVISTGRRNILFSNYREGDVENEAKTEDLLHQSAKIIDVGPLAER